MAPPRPGPLPAPPTGLDSRDLLLRHLVDPLFRIHRLTHDPAFWGTTGRNRFDAPARQFGVLYAAADRHAAFIETYGDSLARTITANSLTDRGWASVSPTRELRLVDLCGPGLAKIGADERLCSGDHAVAQQWSLALWRHPASVDGLCYRARHDPSRVSVALFDRAQSSVRIARHGSLIDPAQRPLLAAILDEYGFSLL